MNHYANTGAVSGDCPAGNQPCRSPANQLTEKCMECNCELRVTYSGMCGKASCFGKCIIKTEAFVECKNCSDKKQELKEKVRELKARKYAGLNKKE